MKEGGMEPMRKETASEAANDNNDRVDAETRAQWQRESTHEQMLERNMEAMRKNLQNTRVVEDKRNGLLGIQVDKPASQEQSLSEDKSDETASMPVEVEQSADKSDIQPVAKAEAKELEEVRTRLGITEKGAAPDESTDLNELLESIEGSPTYTEKNGIAVMGYLFRKLYPNPEMRSKRLMEMAQDFKETLTSSRTAHPDKPISSHESFAMNEVLNSLSATERGAMESFLDEHYKLLGGSGQRLITAAVPLSDFVKSLL